MGAYLQNMAEHDQPEPAQGSLPQRWRAREPDGRSRGTMRQFVREFLSLHLDGRTRRDLRAILLGRLEFRRKLEANPRYISHLVWDLLQLGEIEERDGKLFASEATRLSIAVRQELFELNRDLL